MPNSKTRELFDMSTHDLYDELGKTQQELLNLRFQLKTHQSTNYTRVRVLKRQVARLKTLAHERVLNEGAE